MVRAESDPLGGESFVYTAEEPPAEGDLIQVQLATTETAPETIAVRVARVDGDLIMATEPGSASC